jgi:non-specific serine/threonine protein kinase
LTGALFDYWYAQGLYREGRQWLQQVLVHRDAVPPPVHLRVLGTAGALALVQGDLAEASRLSAVELPLARALGNEHRLVVALFNAALLAQAQEDYAAAERWMREAHDLAHGWTDASIAAPLAGIALGNLGIMASAQGHLDRSLPLFTDAVAMLRDVTYPWPLADALCGLGGVLLRQGRPKEAAPVLLEALDAARQAQDPRWLSTILLAIAGLAVALGRPEEGARLLGAADALAAKLRAPFAATDVAIRALTVSHLTTLPEVDPLAQQRRLGETMTMTQAITDAELLLRELLAQIAPAGATAVGLT